ncbi:hypothetical protein [uncultured Campylobacter sp.]|uniref:GNAT family N-acetyltransferase n=1 Tax=uncultured Campylobacter sp. TaxID=218934 RepID=UPI002629538A|nr:hypothetical protein [uncultured Campylobacter sp.]
MRLERIGEDSALIARIEAINVAAFPEIERISIKNFLKMSRKGQLEIAAIFEDFSALGGGAADKHHAASENLNASKQDFCAVKRDCGEASQDRDAASKNSDASDCGAAEFASLSSENRDAADKKSNTTYEKSSLKSKNSSAASENLCALQDYGEASQNCGSAGNCATAAQNLSGEELVGFCVYRTEQTYKRAVLNHKQPPLRLNADKILRSKAHSGAEFACDAGSFGTASDEISNYVTSNEISYLSVSDGVLGAGADQGLASENIKHADDDLKQASAEEILYRGVATDKISNVSAHDEILPSATEGEISSDAAKGKILCYDESGISCRDESKISSCEKSEPSSGKQGEIFYVAYLGIDAKFRGLGVGSRLLALIAEQNPRAQIVLDVEPPHEDAPNLAQRLRRIEFYGRHGFRCCGKFFNYAGLSFEILAKPPLSAPQQGFGVASFVKFIGAGNKFRFKITDAPLYKN